MGRDGGRGEKVKISWCETDRITFNMAIRAGKMVFASLRYVGDLRRVDDEIMARTYPLLYDCAWTAQWAR